jgi:hypothetical protein
MMQIKALLDFLANDFQAVLSKPLSLAKNEALIQYVSELLGNIQKWLACLGA